MKYMGIYERITKHNKIYLNKDGQVVEPPRRGGGGGSITSVGKVFDVTSFTEEQERKSAQSIEPTDIRIDDEARKALEVLKSKGLI